jgi:BirA family biotin operon repressor/biotin-[acetyl-CoA-carboxylase] ligase
MAPPLLCDKDMMAMLSPRVKDEAWLPDDSLCIDRIRRELSTESIGYEIHLFGQLLCTSDALRALAESGAREGTVVLAETQHVGRGWFGMPWSAPERANLYASVLFRPRIPRRAVRAFAFIAALALADAIATEGASARIRWPNDVLIGGRRVARTHCQASPMGEIADYVVLGVEVNLNVSHEALGRGVGAASAFATSLREALNRRIDRNRFTAAFLNHLERWLGVYRARGAGVILVAWNDLDALRGRVVEVRGKGVTQRGRVAGVDDEGRLVLERGPETERAIASGEIVAVDEVDSQRRRRP